MPNPPCRRPAVAEQLETRRLLSGGGLLVSSGMNTYTGAVAIDPGSLTVTAGGGTLSGGTLTFSGGSPSTPTPTPTSATLGGRVYSDWANGRGYASYEDPTDADLTVYLDANGDGVADATTTTGADGLFAFAGLAAGTYAVRIDVPAGYGLTEPAAGSYTRVLSLGYDQSDLDFGLAPAGSADGTVFTDAGARGTADAGEGAPAGARVVALPVGAGADRLPYYAVPDAAGAFAFPALPIGTYTISAEAGNGWFTSAPFGTADTVVVTAGESATATAIGLAPVSAAATVTGVVFADHNGDGIDEATDYLVYRSTAYLDLNGNGYRDATEPTAATEDYGRFTFSDLPAGTYTVRIELLQDYGSQQLTTLETDTVIVAAGDTATADPIGLGPQPVAGTVRSADGTPRAGATVYLDANANGRLDPGETSTTTAADGTYRLNDLPTGSYVVAQVVPLGQIAAAPGASGVRVADVGYGSRRPATTSPPLRCRPGR